ncbi:laccase 11, partial [Prunus dulcis]
WLEARGSLFPKYLNENSPKIRINNHNSDIKEMPMKLTIVINREKMTSSCWNRFFCGLVLLCFGFLGLITSPAEAAIKKYQFDVQVKNVSRLCHAKSIVTVNGRFPGPTIYVREGDRVVVNVTNHAQYNMHGLKQYRNGWADGPAYITQCPIQTGSSYTYDFNVTGQRGTLWWHAHILWLRATVYGAIVIMPKQGTPFPFPQPHREAEIILGEWWNVDVEEFVKKANNLGLAPNTSDAHTINGKPGPLFPCSEKHTFVMEVEQGKTYLLRIINAALNDELFFAIAGHNLTVVEVDAVYTKPFTTQAILIAPGQTTNVLVQANQASGRYFMATRPFMDAPVPIDNKAATGIFQYRGIPNTVLPSLPQLPVSNDTSFALSYGKKLKSLNTPNFPANVPLKVDRKLFYTIGWASTSHYFNLKGVFKTDFPDSPQTPFNYTGAPLTANLGTSTGTRLSKIAFNSTVELVLQDTNLLTVETHPFHLHGYNFFVVGTGIGNFDPAKDPAKYNLVDPVERNTVGVPTGGWTAIRFRADNPASYRLGTENSIRVEDGPGSDQSVLPVPKDLPPC